MEVTYFRLACRWSW